LHLKDGICNRFFCVYLVKRQMGRFKRVFVVWHVIYSTRQRKTTRTNGNKPNGKRFSFVGLPFWLCRVLQDDSERHFFSLFFFVVFQQTTTNKDTTPPPKTLHFIFHAGEDALFIFLAFSLHTRRRKASYKVLS